MFKPQELNKKSPVPLYYQLQQIIVTAIKNKYFLEGDILPTEIELSEMFKISRPTVRQALKNLVEKGYLYRIKGKGTFVTKPKVTQEYTRFIESYNSSMLKNGLIPKTIVLDKKVLKADNIISKKLQIKEGEEVIKLKRVRYANHLKEEEVIFDTNKPILVTTVYTPKKIFPELLNYDFEVFSFYEVLEKNNLKVKKVIRELEAKNIDKENAEILEINENDAVTVISSIGYLEDGQPIEFSTSIYPGERNKFIIEISK
ncbi:GntR family transcriptional regulator [Oceanotoga teriensis]|jgi:GntR family transcriptional regulator|uniref:GntR family transcriptional regulator n=1 Tax=Oceanotoga teriensis TaxID=515440 RepID=A0AA45HI14_9BACT|nr:GntR family transcriptional regulator [Oceanotoga teriensis]PWJ89013.1 GntR family transcriptional regulator [Oceanotoga teriensis]